MEQKVSDRQNDQHTEICISVHSKIWPSAFTLKNPGYLKMTKQADKFKLLKRFKKYLNLMM